MKRILAATGLSLRSLILAAIVVLGFLALALLPAYVPMAIQHAIGWLLGIIAIVCFILLVAIFFEAGRR